MAHTTIDVKRDIREEQRAAAQAFRDTMTRQGTLVVRLLSSPGSGKTTLLEKTCQALRSKGFSVGVLVGDVETERDAERLAPFAPTVQITTGGACHLEISLIERALPSLGSKRFDILFIEDVGNLICPASHDLGEHLRTIVLSVTEGDDKPGKYPKAFRTSNVMVISKTDLLPHVPFSIQRAEEDALRIQPNLDLFAVSAFASKGLDAWCNYLETARLHLLAGQGQPSPECRDTSPYVATERVFG
jgi:hydrogenase nickel incorporation protein HypB